MTGFEDLGGWPRRSELFLSYFLLSPHTVNMTLSTSLIADGFQLKCSEHVISHCPLCLVKLSTEFCMASTAVATSGFGITNNDLKSANPYLLQKNKFP